MQINISFITNTLVLRIVRNWLWLFARVILRNRPMLEKYRFTVLCCWSLPSLLNMRWWTFNLVLQRYLHLYTTQVLTRVDLIGINFRSIWQVLWDHWIQNILRRTLRGLSDESLHWCVTLTRVNRVKLRWHIVGVVVNRNIQIMYLRVLNLNWIW